MPRCHFRLGRKNSVVSAVEADELHEGTLFILHERPLIADEKSSAFGAYLQQLVGNPIECREGTAAVHSIAMASPAKLRLRPKVLDPVRVEDGKPVASMHDS